jgi:hypothetical protein
VKATRLVVTQKNRERYLVEEQGVSLPICSPWAVSLGKAAHDGGVAEWISTGLQNRSTQVRTLSSPRGCGVVVTRQLAMLQSPVRFRSSALLRV